MDVNSDGVLSPDELSKHLVFLSFQDVAQCHVCGWFFLETGIKKGMTKMSAEEEKEFDSNLDQAIEEVDLDHNGFAFIFLFIFFSIGKSMLVYRYVDYEEFVQMWMKSDIGKARESVHGDKSRKK